MVIVIVHFSTFQCPSPFNSHMTLHSEMRICLILCEIDRDGEQNKHPVLVGGVVIKCFQNTKRRKIPDTFHSYILANSMFEISYIFLSATTAICQSISLFLDCVLPLECVSWLVLDTFFQALLFSFSFEIFSFYSPSISSTCMLAVSNVCRWNCSVCFFHIWKYFHSMHFTLVFCSITLFNVSVW